MKINLLEKVMSLFKSKNSNIFNGDLYFNSIHRQRAYHNWKCKIYGEETMRKIDKLNYEQGKLWDFRNDDVIRFYDRKIKYKDCSNF